MAPGDLWQVALSLIGAGAVYGGIRADLRSVHERIEHLSRTAKRAHKRLDRHISEGGGDGRKRRSA